MSCGFRKTKKKLTSKTRIEKMLKAFIKQGGTNVQFQFLLDEVRNPWSDANFIAYRRVEKEGETTTYAEFNECNAEFVMKDGKVRYFSYTDDSESTLAPYGQYGLDKTYGFRIHDGEKKYFDTKYAFYLEDGEGIEKMYDYLFVQQRAHKDNWILDNVDSF